MTAFDIGIGTIPQDETPPTFDAVTGDFDPDYPGSTQDHPYGFFPDGRPRKRRPHSRGSSASPSSTGPVSGRSKASESQARSAAALLAQMNVFVSGSVMLLGMPLTGQAINEANDQFRDMAYEALVMDPALCRKILSAGGSSGKAALIMAYGMLVMSIVPTGVMEIRAAKSATVNENGEFV